MLAFLVALVGVLTAALHLYLARRYSTWRRKGVPGPPATAFPLGVPKVLLAKESMADVADRVYREHRSSPVAGTYIFGKPLLHIHDPEIIKLVFVKEFHDFSGRGTAANDFDPMSTHLFFTSGQKWRYRRLKLAPAFTSGKIKYMFGTIRKSSEQLVEYLDAHIARGAGSYSENARSLMMRVFVDTVALVAFGIDSNVLYNPDSPFLEKVQAAVAPTHVQSLRALLAVFAREAMTALHIHNTNQSTSRFFLDVVRDTVEYREKNDVNRADLLALLMQLKNQGFVTPDKQSKPDEEGVTDDQGAPQKMTLDEVASEVFIFTIAGFESSSSTTSFTLWEMARNPEILKKAVDEVDQVLAKFNGEITYETIMSMSYLDKCVSETLRKYPPLPFLTREAQVTRKVPLTDVVVEKATRVIVPVRALHYDPEYYPDPERYDPERFSEEQKAARPSFAYLPFGQGPRICIAARLGLVQIKTVLVTVLSKYNVSVDPNAPSKVPIDPKVFATTPSIPLTTTFTLRKDASS